MRFFFYGTLMDRDVLACVLARPVIAAALKPATLRGWRRCSVRGASYPVVVRDRGQLAGAGVDSTGAITRGAGDRSVSWGAAPGIRPA